jgi:hypothetical protein
MIDITRADTVSALWKHTGQGLGNYWTDSRSGKVMAPERGIKWIEYQGTKAKVKTQTYVNDDGVIEQWWPAEESTNGDVGQIKIKETVLAGHPVFWELLTLRDRLVEGYMSPYNKRLKTTVYLICGSFLKSNSPYRALYDRQRVYYSDNREDWSKARQSGS